MLAPESKRKPTRGTDSGHAWAFRVWAYDPTLPEDPKPWKLCALFRYNIEALDYIDHCRKHGATVYYQSPNGISKWEAAP